MEVFLNRIDGWDDAISSMFFSKRNMDRDFEETIRDVCYEATCPNPCLGTVGQIVVDKNSDNFKEFFEWLDKLFKWSVKHITLAKFIDLSFTVYGLHRAGQDDWDSHAKRFDNRIIRSSTRLADFSNGELSDYYADKILPTDMALTALGIDTPEEIEYNGKTYVKAVNGYIVKGMENKKDVKRGLYMLSIPSNFIFKINLAEFAHVYKERNEKGTANPEVKQCCEAMVDQLEKASLGYINREFLMNVKN